jgi:excisionase family DNA binding protein
MGIPTEFPTATEFPMPAQRAPSEVLTIEQVAAWLKMSRRQVYEMTRSRGQARMDDPIPMLRINGNVRFRRVDVDAWLSRLAERGGQ